MKPFDAWSQTTRLGVALLLTSATLFAFDVGGTFALDRGIEKAGGTVAPVLEQPVASGAAAPLGVAQAVAPAAQPQRVVSVPAPVHVVAPPRIASSVHVAKPVRIATPVRVAAPRRITVRAGAKTVAVASHRRKAIVALATQPRRVAVAARPVLAKAAPVRRAQVRPPQQVATLRDVRKYVMHVLASRYRGLSVISAATYAGDGGVVVNMVVHDRRREWFEKDIVHRAGSELSILSERQRVMPGTVRRPPFPNLPRSKLT